MIDPANAEQYFALLTDLLAVIHGDGGHHAQRHGLEESCRQAHARIADLRRELDAAKSAPTAGASDLWYSYDPEEGYDTWSTAQEAENAAAASLEHFRDQSTDGWHEDVGGISWGRLVAYAYATKCDEQPTEPGSEFDYTCDYVLQSIR